LFLTDGEITEGEKNVNKLKMFVKDNCHTTFIGYGLDHDSVLLSKLSTGKDNQYRFVDALEKAGFVYGEIAHEILYKALTNVSVSTTCCEIYDFVTNKWTNTLYIGDLLSEQTKVYHIRTKNAELSLEINGQNELLEPEHIKVGAQKETVDLSEFILRQRTQELLYEAKKLSYKYEHMPLFYRVEKLAVNDQEDLLKIMLKDFKTLIETYIKEHNKEDSLFLKNLTDDIYIAYITLGTKHSNMYSIARQTSQGRQQAYNCINLPNLSMFEDLDNVYTISQSVVSPYSTEKIVHMMREVSGTQDETICL
jgi:cytochrome b involved in lipid metabolism